jgi:hypothetical protein
VFAGRRRCAGFYAYRRYEIVRNATIQRETRTMDGSRWFRTRSHLYDVVQNSSDIATNASGERAACWVAVDGVVRGHAIRCSRVTCRLSGAQDKGKRAAAVSTTVRRRRLEDSSARVVRGWSPTFAVLVALSVSRRCAGWEFAVPRSSRSAGRRRCRRGAGAIARSSFERPGAPEPIARRA